MRVCLIVNSKGFCEYRVRKGIHINDSRVQLGKLGAAMMIQEDKQVSRKDSLLYTLRFIMSKKQLVGSM